MKDEANGSSTTPNKPQESPGEIQIPHFKKKSDLEGFLKESKKKPNQLIVLNFTTTWCQPCIKAEEPLKKLVKKFNIVKFANVDVDHFLDLVNARKVNVVKMPTFLLMKPSQSSNKEDASEGSEEKEAKYIIKGKKSQIYNFKEIDRVEGVRKDLKDLEEKIESTVPR